MIFTLAGMLAVFFMLPRLSVVYDIRAWRKDGTDRYGKLWHENRFVIRGVIVVAAAILGHIFWLWGRWAPLLDGVTLATFLGGCYFMYDFNPRLNLERAKKEPWVTEWYVSRSATTAEFDKLLCEVADKLERPTDVILKRVVKRGLYLGTLMYVIFLVSFITW